MKLNLLIPACMVFGVDPTKSSRSAKVVIIFLAAFTDEVVDSVEPLGSGWTDQELPQEVLLSSCCWLRVEV